MLHWRLLSAAVILGGLLTLLWLDFSHNFGHPGIWLAPAFLVIGLLATEESLDLLRDADLRPVAWSVYLGVAMVLTASCAPILWKSYPLDCPLGKPGWPLTALAASLVVAFVAEMRRYESPGRSIIGVALASFVICYVGLLGSFLAALRLFHDNAWGMAALVSVLLIVKAADTGAYACGRLLGRHKLAPRLSPGKTMEGAVGGVLFACAASLLYFQFLVPWVVGPEQPRCSFLSAVGYAVTVSLAGMIGDLAESLFKRDVGRKDSSRWLPGLGGVLDILDSVLVAAPAAFFCWAAGLVGPC